MSSDWQDAKWGDLITLEYGKAFRNYKNSIGPYVVYGTNGPIGFHNQALYEKASVIVGRKGAYRGIHYSPAPFYVIDTAFYLKPKTEINMKWAYYQLLTHDINSMDSGSAIPSTSRDAFYKLSIKVPPLKEQKIIADILSSLDDKIELNRQICKTLEDIASILFKSWFIDFDPVKAKAAGQEPEGLNQEIADLFPDSFIDSPLGKIPNGWKIGEISNLAEVNSGKRPAYKESNKSKLANIPIYGSGGVMGYTDKFLYSTNVLLTGRVGTLGIIFRITYTCWPSDNTLILLTKNYAFNFLYFILKKNNLKALNKGSTQPLLTQSDLIKLKTTIPPIDLLEQFQKITSNIFEKVTTIENNIENLTFIRETLLPKLINGEIQIKKLEKF